ncbi:hypothetical protein [Mangrovibacterium sp.]|uniref:hypothetical protein n=1 Tax=Mangrovibacterium sp. TaxID=1961364 RepID=UPI00356220DD
MKLRRWQTFLLIFLVVCRAMAQVPESQNSLLEVPIYFSGINPEHAIGLFSLDLPFFFPVAGSPKSKLAVSYTMANTWHPKAWVYYPQNLTNDQQALNRQLYITWRPTYFEAIDAKSTVKSYQSDGVLQHFRVAWLRQWNKKNSFILNLNAHLLSGGSSPLHYFVSDRFIESFHSRFAVEDNYGRKLFPYNRAAIQFTDEDGNTYRKEKGDFYTSVIDMHYYRELLNSASAYSRVQFIGGLHLSVPVNNLHRFLVPGVSAGFRLDRLTNALTSVTLAIDAGLTNQTFLEIGGGVKAIDRTFRESLKLYLGANFAVGKKGTLKFGLLNNFQGALMKGSNNDWGQVDYPEIGIRFLKQGDVWEGEEITQEFWLARTTPASLYYYSYKAFVVIGWQRNSRQFNFYVGEDLFFINNAPDFQLGFEYVLPLSGSK